MLNTLAGIYFKQGKMDQAIATYQKAAAVDPNPATAYYNLCALAFNAGKYDDAAAQFRAVLRRNPSDTQASMLEARCSKQSGPRPGDPATEGLERLKTNYEESAYWQLKAALQPDKP